MVRIATFAGAALLFAVSASASARTNFETTKGNGGSGELAAVLQCVPYARQVTGIDIYGDAHTWWGQAKGRFKRGNRPKIGAVMAVRPHSKSRLGHVAAVSGILDSRTVLLRHANWSQPGLIEDNVRAVDVSSNNDWSEVRIWYVPTQSLGSTHWPLYGFIYSDGPGKRAPNKPARTSNDIIADIIAGKIR
ncbi:MAG: CHAP domain-containing protein [Sphingomonadaceae bacterium]|nr:CHAP domain-containing protein [Sphingomonadaceae bacterium]